jgi:hypothetical protein
MTHVTCGRCRSGKRWFWIAAEWLTDSHRCDDPVCIYGGPHEYGWEDTEELAIKAMGDAVARIGGEVGVPCYQGNAPGRASMASGALKRINAARRKTRTPKPGAASAASVEYLYEPWSWTDYDNPPYETLKGIGEIPVVKKTAKRIYYDATSRWDKHDGVVTLGYISRYDLETDTRCRDTCPVNIQVARCSGHQASYPHCAHLQAFYRKAQYEAHRAACSAECPLDVTTTECAPHGYTWEHCPHGHRDCFRGLPAGAARLPDNAASHGGGIVYTTREAAEEHLFSGDRERERQREDAEPEIRRLRREMAAVHPDRGGTNEEFIAARKRYKDALRRVS